MQIGVDSLRWALMSLKRFGDTDLFPRPIELDALCADIDGTAARLATIDLSGYVPGAARRFIVPKDDLSYRQATQLDPLDTVLMTALVREHGDKLESRRRPIDEASVFSYRFRPSTDGELFSGANAWNEFWRHCAGMAATGRFVLMADIADFYNQIAHHTIENQLIDAGWPNQAKRAVIELLKATSASVSRGLPVGPHWVHVLAESTLAPVDNSLAARGITFARFVDDYMIFADSEENARAALYALAEILDKQQHLHLQNAKTRIMKATEFMALCSQMIEDRPINDLERLMVDVIRRHSHGNPYRTILLSELTEEEIKAFTPGAVEKILGDYMRGDSPDFIRLRWFLRRLAQVGHSAGVDFCLREYERLLPAISDVSHYLISVGESGEDVRWLDVGGLLLDALDRPIVRANEYFQLSLLGLFSRVVQLNHLPRLIGMFSSSSPTIRREVILAAEAAVAVDWLREQKEHFAAMDPWSRRAFLFASRRLPADERKFFLQTVQSPTGLEDLIISYARGGA